MIERYRPRLRALVRHTDACHSQGRKEPTGSLPSWLMSDSQ